MSISKITNQLKTKYLLFLILIFLSSCGSKKNIALFQNSESAKEITSNFEPKFKADDLIRIFVFSVDAEASLPFNLSVISSVPSRGIGTSQIDYQNYLIDNMGFIDFPVLGKIKIGGLTRKEFIENLKQKLKPYFKTDPIVNVAIINYKISVTGEVAKPGSFNINSERISLVDALALAGDLTIYGKRTNIIVLRDIDGVKTINRVDITKTDFINSEFYYLTQNDVIYVEPNKTRVNASAIGPNASVIISGLSLLITVFALLRK